MMDGETSGDRARRQRRAERKAHHVSTAAEASGEREEGVQIAA